MMNFKQKVSSYILGVIPTSDLPEIGIIGLQENLKSDLLNILAGMSKEDNAFNM